MLPQRKVNIIYLFKAVTRRLTKKTPWNERALVRVCEKPIGTILHDAKILPKIGGGNAQLLLVAGRWRDYT